jgi:hypothetical protein
VPSSPLGDLLVRSTPEPRHRIDVTALLTRSRSRQRRRALVAMGVAVAATAGVVTGVQALDPGTKAVRPLATKPPSPGPTQWTPDPSPTFPPAPDVIGMDVDAAMVRLGQGDCMGTERVAHDAAPVGKVVAQATAANFCEVTLTVSAGPVGSAPTCTNVAIDAGPLGAAAGTAGFAVIIRNVAAAPCSLQGYPDVTATESGTDRTVVARDTPDGSGASSAGATTSYLLRTGDHVSAMVSGSDNPVGAATSCTELHPFRVSVNGPGATLNRTLYNCSGIEVHEFVPGATGWIR